MDERLPRLLEDAELRLSVGCAFRFLLAQLTLELEQLAARIEPMDAVIQKTAKENEACQRLTEIPGVGPVTATALIGAIGNGSAFGKGRALSAWMGIVPGGALQWWQAEVAVKSALQGKPFVSPSIE